MNVHLVASLLILTTLSVATGNAQSPAPVIVQAANAPSTGTPTTLAKMAAAAENQGLEAAIRLLEQIKAGNDDVLAKQKAALERLDEIKESAAQLQVFAKRG